MKRDHLTNREHAVLSILLAERIPELPAERLGSHVLLERMTQDHLLFGFQEPYAAPGRARRMLYVPTNLGRRLFGLAELEVAS